MKKNKMLMKVIVDPRARISYASFYIHGLYQIFEKKNVIFSIKPFEDLKQDSKADDFEQYFAFVYLTSGVTEKKIVIDYRDRSILNQKALQWCDVYGKVNLNKKDNGYMRLAEELKDKIISIGPNFGVNLWSYFQTIWYLTNNYCKCIGKLPVGFRDFFAGYNWQVKRKPYGFYTPSVSDKNFIFHISSFYHNQSHGDVVNRLRAEFIRACMRNNCNFLGGLYKKIKSNVNSEYKDVLIDKYFKPSVYIENIRRSAFVFNTPAAWGCHGWKLGEYLAMGKAVISTPFVNDMPEAMEHNVNIIFVENYKEINDIVKRLLSDELLRKKLEKGARSYYKKWLTPQIVIERLININFLNAN